LTETLANSLGSRLVAVRENGRDIVMNGEMCTLFTGRTAYWYNGTVVIRNPGAIDGGTAFRPTDGYDYFLGLH